jgi:mono/diheme cytochrome c family protein
MLKYYIASVKLVISLYLHPNQTDHRNNKESKDMYSKIFKIVSLVIAIVLAFSLLTACGTKATETPQSGGETGEVAGKPGPAVDLTGDATAGAAIFKDNCEECHGAEGKGGVANPGATEPTVPGLNPLDPEFVSSDAKTFATNIDIFIEHGATPEGDNPAKVMKAFGDDGILTPQQIADVIAYVISLNK